MSKVLEMTSVFFVINLNFERFTNLFISSISSSSPPTEKDEEEADRYVIPDPLPKHDMTLEELRKYDGKGPDKRVCIAILGRVYDCSKSE